MALSCISGKTNIAAQTLFLGASIADFNVNMAWGGQPARLSVKLVEDNSGCTDPPFRGGVYGDNHFNECSSDSDCFIDENGNAFDPNISQERIVPGKVYYKWDSTKGFVSQYWYNADPGFFGRKSSINYAGLYDINSYNNNAGLDIINTPVIFKMGDFSFAGLVQSWEENYDSGGLNYNISIESMDSLLEQSWIILDKHAGAVYGKLGNNTYGGPTNWIDGGLEYKGSIRSGNISNVFNIYGFLESMGIGNFGGSNKNDNGISAAVIMDALSVLTSCDNTTALDAQNKRAFSPFGRILAKVAQEHISYNRVTSNLTDALGMGILPVVDDDNGQIRCPFVLDLSELPRPPLDYRIQDPAMSILSFIQTVTTATGSDFYIETIPVTYSSKKYNVLKVKTITRSAQPNPRQIQNTIDAFINSGYKITSSRLGKEKNNNTNRVLYLGAPQQRLFQAKSYRLAFSQSQYVYNPNKKKFVEYYGAVAGTNNAGQPGKYRAPNALSTRNPAMVSNFTSKYASLFAIDEDIKNAVDSSRFDNVDSVWGDAYLSGTTRTGNYSKTINITKSSSESGSGTRFFPLYKDIVSPFFGFKHEENFAVNTTAGQSNVFRRVRPVWMDSWSGQILVLMELAELPKTLSVPLVSPYSGSTIFTISESEIRASDNLDSFITYCQGKIFKPDLFRMLKTAYTLSKKVIFDREINAVPYVAQGNSAGATGAPVSPRPVSHTMGTDYNLFMSQDFLRDLNIIREFIHRIGSYYGKKYLVKMPEVMSYKDQQYQSSTIPGSLTTEGSTGSPIQVYQGSGKIFYSYEPASDGAWEEYGNIIDDSIVVGSTDWYSLIDDNGKIQPIVGYNATESVDYVGRALVNYLSSRVGTRITPVTTTTPTTPTTSTPAAAATPTTTPTPQAAAPIVVPWDQYQLISIINNLKKKIGSSNLNNIDNFKYSTIDLSGLSEDDIVIKNSTVATKDALGEDVGNAKKIYCKTTVDQQFVFLDPVNLRFACAIINAPGPSLNSSSKFYTQDPLNSVVAVASMEDLAIYSKIYSSSLGNRKAVIRILTSRISHILGDDDYLLHIESNSSPQHHRMRSKVAHPYFAAVPVKSNVYSYGPWTNYLDLDKNLIFPDAVGSVDNAVENVVGGVKVEVKSDFAPWNYGGMSFLDSAALSEIYGEVQYQQVIETATLSMPGLPIFGIGSSFEMPSPRVAGGSSIYYNNQEYTISTVQLNYTKKTKTPSANERLPQFRLPVYSPLFDEPTINNIPLNYNTIILSSSASPVSPIISSISCNISPQSVSTSYSFRTYTQKLGFFNKENSERIKLAGLNNIKANKQLASLSQSFNNKIYIESRNNARDTTVGDYDAQKFETGFYGKSPTQILIGMASSYASPPVDMKTILNKAINDTTTNEEFYIRCGADPGDQKTLNLLNANSGMLAFMNNVRWNTEVGAFMSSEATTDLGTNYSLKSAMSFDGIFSPISFYPTKFNTTYSLFKQIRKNCIECNGTGKITENVYMVGGDSVESVEYACPYCSFKRPQLSSSTTTRANKTESLPPYIITNDNDINTLLQFNTSSSLSISSASNTTDTSKKTGLDIPVNAVSLQPIVVPYGEFKNNNVQSDDRSRHCIQVVARGNTPPQSGALYNLNTNLKILVNPADGNIIDTQGQGVNADYYAFDIRAQFDDVSNSTNKIPMNQRFFGLRGPLMVHGWGYDLEGYPVPNASDEPQFLDTKGRPARFVHKIEPKGSVEYKKLKIGDTFSLTEYNANDINQFAYYTKTINTQVLDTSNNWKIPNDNDTVYKIIVSNDLESTPSNPLSNTNSVFNSGDIITKQYTHNGTKWVKGPRSRQFYLNWAERPDIWPVGPIDLRWDENRRVWTINAGSPPYKLVYVTLEEDLLKENDFDESYPAKGFLDDIEYSKEPLQTGYRRLVYVRDKTGYTAPRGVKLLCRYDTDSGFYEPVSKPSIIAYGTTSSGNQASITMDYAQGNRAIQSPILTIKFANPLELAVRASAKGIFTYLRGQWILTSIG